MKKAAVLLAEGFEEGEALTIADILRRAHIQADLVSIAGDQVTGAHNITVVADLPLPQSLLAYDMVVLPGGLPGASNLQADDRVIKAVREMDAEGKFVAAVCAAPIVLGRAGLLDNRSFTAYPGYEEKIDTTGRYGEDLVVRDGNIITSRGPATAYAFAYALVDALGGDSLAVKNRMVYFNAFDAEGRN